jgi:pyruvate/2-oxoglutarate dehydrogenase complex dihydrolipoamide acyltransferase (E2) component
MTLNRAFGYRDLPWEPRDWSAYMDDLETSERRRSYALARERCQNRPREKKRCPGCRTCKEYAKVVYQSRAAEADPSRAAQEAPRAAPEKQADPEPTPTESGKREPLDARIFSRLTTEERQEAEQLAKRRKTNVSAIVRRLLKEHLDYDRAVRGDGPTRKDGS